MQFLDEEMSCVFTENMAHILSRSIKMHFVLLEEALCVDFTICPSQFITATVFKVIHMECILMRLWDKDIIKSKSAVGYSSSTVFSPGTYLEEKLKVKLIYALNNRST